MPSFIQNKGTLTVIKEKAAQGLLLHQDPSLELNHGREGNRPFSQAGSCYHPQ